MIFKIPCCHPPFSRSKSERVVFEREKFAIIARYVFGDYEVPKRVSVVLEISRRSFAGSPTFANLATGVMKTLDESGLLSGKRIVRLKVKRGKRKENAIRLTINDYDKNTNDRAV